jgi:hypothetical protein
VLRLTDFALDVTSRNGLTPRSPCAYSSLAVPRNASSSGFCALAADPMVLKRWLISSMRALASVAVSLIAMDTAVSVMLGHRKRFDWLIDAPEIAAVLVYFGWPGAMWAPEPIGRVAAWFAISLLVLIILAALLALLDALIRFPRL